MIIENWTRADASLYVALQRRENELSAAAAQTGWTLTERQRILNRLSATREIIGRMSSKRDRLQAEGRL